MNSLPRPPPSFFCFVFGRSSAQDGHEDRWGKMTALGWTRVVTALLALALAPPRATAGISRNYLCFFAANSSELTERCRLIAGDFAAFWRSTRDGTRRAIPTGEPVPPHSLRVRLTGHTDTLEDSIPLSEARRRSGIFLVSEGIPRELITTEGKGSAFPLTPTGPRVDEPQNRYVSLIFR